MYSIYVLANICLFIFTIKATNSNNPPRCAKGKCNNHALNQVSIHPSRASITPSPSISHTHLDQPQQRRLHPPNLDRRQKVDDAQCGCTVNGIAGLAYWFPLDFYVTIGKVETSTGRNKSDISYTITQYSTSFNLDAAIQSADIVYDFTEGFDTSANEWVLSSSVITTLPPPVAASTTVTTLSEVVHTPPAGWFGKDEYLTLFTMAENPTYTISSGAVQLTATPNDPVLYVTEIELITYGTGQNGNLSCPQAETITQTLEQAQRILFPSPMAASNLTSIATPTDSLDADFVKKLSPNFTNCVPGSWAAPDPTMIVIVREIYWQGISSLIRTEETQLGGLLGPGPTPTIGLLGGATDNIPAGSALPVAAPSNPPFDAPLPAILLTEAPSSPVLTVNGQTFTVGDDAPGFVISGQTVRGGEAITVDQSTVLSLGSGPIPTVVFVNGSPQPIAVVTQAPTLNIAGTAIPQLPGGLFVVNGQTLLPGQVITVAGTVVSLGAKPTYVVVNGATSYIAPSAVPVLTLGGTTYSATSNSGAYYIGGKTLVPGSAITIGGSTISLAPGATMLVVDGVTQTLALSSSVALPTATAESHKTGDASGLMISAAAATMAFIFNLLFML